MGIDWDSTLKQWAEAVDQDSQLRGSRTKERIKAAIDKSEALKGKTVDVVVAGSYRTNTNTRKGSDVDVIVALRSTVFCTLPAGLTKEMVGIKDGDYTLDMFRSAVGDALQAEFGKGRIAAPPGNKAFRIAETPLELEADVPVFFEHRRYTGAKDQAGRYVHDAGVELQPRNDRQKRVIAWPEQRFAAIERRNLETKSTFVRHIRILKRLRDDMISNGTPTQKNAATPVPSYLVESLLANVPNDRFTLENGAYTRSAPAVLDHLISAIAPKADTSKLKEMSGMLGLFDADQRWSREMAYAFVYYARERLRA